MGGYGKAPWYVYGLVDPRDGEIFYIGCTSNPSSRLKGHFTDSAAGGGWGRHYHLRKTGLKIEMVILSKHLDFCAARLEEWRQIQSRKGLVNGQQHYAAPESTRDTRLPSQG